MRAMVLTEFKKPFVETDVPVPAIGNGDLLVKVKACGVCYTDVKLASGLNPDIVPPTILGHEVAGEVAGVGKDVKQFHEGDRVCLCHYVPCGKCHNCLSGRENLCSDIRGKIGYDANGGYAEFVKAPWTNAHKIADSVSFGEAAILVDAVATPFHALREQAQLRGGETLAIIGAGGLGLQAVQIGKYLGAKVVAIDLEEKRLEMARTMGAVETFNGAKVDVVKAVSDYTQGRGMDVVLDLVGRDETLNTGIKLLRGGGTLVVVGYNFDKPFSILPVNIMRGEYRIIGSRTCKQKDLKDVIDLVAQRKIKPIVSEVVPLEQVNSVHDRLKKNEILGRVVLNPEAR